MTCKDILPACFDGRHHFAGETQPRLKALEYLKCHLEALDTWLEAQQEIEDYLRSLKVISEIQIDEEIEKARSLLAPWLP